MGITHVKVGIANPLNPDQRRELEFLVDSGAIYSVVPRSVLTELGITAHSQRTFTLADGRQIVCAVGSALFVLGDRQASSLVVFSEEQSPCLLGIVALKELGLGLDPLRRELLSIPLPLMPFSLMTSPTQQTRWTWPALPLCLP
jgi:clan AA aspartic protease